MIYKKNQDEVKFPQLLVSRYHSLSAYTVPRTILSVINRIQTSPQRGELKVMLNLKFGEKQHCHLRWLRPSQSKASPAVRGGQEDTDPWTESSAHSRLLPKSSFLTGTSMDCVFCGHYGISLLIKIVRAYFKKLFQKEKNGIMQIKTTHNPTTRDNIYKHTHTRARSSRIFFYVGLWANWRIHDVISKAVVFNLCIKVHLQTLTLWANLEGN